MRKFIEADRAFMDKLEVQIRDKVQKMGAGEEAIADADDFEINDFDEDSEI